jgi:phosphate transport system protein
MRSEFHAGLDALETHIQETGTIVVQAVRAAVVSLEEVDHDLVEHVAGLDREVDGRFLDTERQVEELLARQGPVAIDLRIVLTVLHVNLHLERMSHNALRVARMCAPTFGLDADEAIVQALKTAGGRASEMVRVALDAFALRDLERATSLPRLDEVVDEETGRVLEMLLDAGSRDEGGPRTVLTARCFERIGDHAVKIGERVAYLLTGELREFTNAA